MNESVLPLPLIGGICLVIALICLFWSSRPRRRTDLLARIVLRWFHSLVWLFIGAACFVAPVAALGGVITAASLVALAVFCYVAYMAISISDRLGKAKT